MSAAQESHKCPELHCTASLTTKSNLRRHMGKHRHKVRMPCGKELRDHPTNNARHKKNCCKCQSVQTTRLRWSVIAEAGGGAHLHPTSTKPDGSAFPARRAVHPAMPEPHTAAERAMADVDYKTRVSEEDPSAGTGYRDEIPGLNDFILKFMSADEEASSPVVNFEHFVF